MFKGDKDLDIPEDRFYQPPTEVPMGVKPHNNYIKMRKDGIVKQFVVQEEKTVQQMIDQFNSELEEKQKFKMTSTNFIIVANDLKTNVKVKIDKKLNGSQLFQQGLNDIEIESAFDSNGKLKYPEVPVYSQPNSQQQYFGNNQKIKSKVQQPPVISIKLIYQSIDQPQKTKIINMNTSQTILDLKKKTKQAFGIASIQSILLEDEMTMIFQKDKNTLAFQGLFNGCNIYVRVVNDKACYPADSKIKVLIEQNNRKILVQKYISDIKIGDKVLSYNQKGFFQEDTVTYIKNLTSKVIMQIKLKNGKSIRSTPGDKYLTQQGWKKYSIIGRIDEEPALGKIKLSQSDKLVHYLPNQQNQNGSRKEYIQIDQIQVIDHQNPVQLYHLSIQKNHTYIVNGFVVHNMQIQIYDPLNGNIHPMQVTGLDLVQTIKKKVATFIKLKVQQFKLIYTHKQLDQKRSLNDYNIIKGDKIQINRLKKLKQQPSQIIAPNMPKQKWLIIKDRGQSYPLKYESVKKKTVSRVLEEIKKTNCPKYCSLIQGNNFLGPMSLINEVQKIPNFKELTQIQCIMVRSAQKKLFYDLILTNDYTKIIESFKDPNKRSELIKKFRTDKFNRTICDQIFRFDPSDQDTTDQMHMRELRQVVLGFIAMEKYENTTAGVNMKLENGKTVDVNVMDYDLYKKQRYYGFNKRYKKGDSFYFKEFVQTKKKNYQEVIASKPYKQTVFFIRSLSGRNLGKISETQKEEEVVFLPFTYFTVEEIILDSVQAPTVEYIFLTQMETLFNYKKTFLIWVDDLPNNRSNKKIYEELVEKHKGLQIMKLLSTKQAIGWMNEFAWLLNWQNIHFKMISDMTRFQVDTTKKNKLISQIKNDIYIQFPQKSSAAIDLIEQSCDQKGFTTLITIFCMDAQNAKKRVNDRNLKQGLNYHQITTDMDQLTKNVQEFLERYP